MFALISFPIRRHSLENLLKPKIERWQLVRLHKCSIALQKFVWVPPPTSNTVGFTPFSRCVKLLAEMQNIAGAWRPRHKVDRQRTWRTVLESCPGLVVLLPSLRVQLSPLGNFLAASIVSGRKGEACSLPACTFPSSTSTVILGSAILMVTLATTRSLSLASEPSLERFLILCQVAKFTLQILLHGCEEAHYVPALQVSC